MTADGMKIDLGLVGDLADSGRLAAELEELGVDGTFSFEGVHGPFLPLALAAASTSAIDLWTGIAVAFARNPMTAAQDAHDLQTISGGRFHLGLGSQIRPHIERRFSMPWSDPVGRMEEFVRAVRAIWHTWRTGEALAFEGEHYQHTLMTPLFTPQDMHSADPSIVLAGVGSRMVAAAGRVADALLVHPFHSRDFLDADTVPALRAAADGRDVDLWIQTMVAVGDDEEQVADARRRASWQLGFYGSTPAYRGMLDHHGLGELQPRLRDLTRAGDWAGLTAVVPDELIDLVVVSGSVEDVAERLRSRNADAARTALVPYDGTADGSGAARLVAALQS